MRKINSRVGLCIGLLSLTTLSACLQTRQAMDRPTLGNVKRSYNRNQKKYIMGGACAALLATAALSGGMLYANSYANSPSLPTTPGGNSTTVTSTTPYTPPTTIPGGNGTTVTSTTPYIPPTTIPGGNGTTVTSTPPYIPPTTIPGGNSTTVTSTTPYTPPTTIPGGNGTTVTSTTTHMPSTISFPPGIANVTICPIEKIKNPHPESCDIYKSDYVRCLIENGGDLNSIGGPTGKTPLMDEVIRGDFKSENNIELLINCGANLEVKNKNSIGETALMYAAAHNNNEGAKLLLDGGANLEAIDDEESTALMHAIVHNRYYVVEFFIDRNANLNAQDKKGKTALMHAIYHKDYSKKNYIIKLLLRGGAKLDLKDKDGKTALMYAEERGDIEIINLLKEASKQTRT